jgi:hypothetical protein
VFTYSRDFFDKNCYSVTGQLNKDINLFTAPRVIGESDCVKYVQLNQFGNYIFIEFEGYSFLRLYSDGYIYGARFGNLKRCKETTRAIIALFQTLS